MKQSKEKEKEQKAKSKIVSQYLEQTKQDHQIEIEELRQQISELKQATPIKIEKVVKPIKTEPSSEERERQRPSVSMGAQTPMYEVKEKIVEKVVERVVEDTTKIKRMNTTIND